MIDLRPAFHSKTVEDVQDFLAVLIVVQEDMQDGCAECLFRIPSVGEGIVEPFVA
ncbi:MAG: hypothetical protein R2855_18325 [Thermomicrobiales bacterium]